MNILTETVIKSIDFYQKELSHKKKYCCAHGVLHQGLTCSEYSKQKIATVGMLLGIKETFFRLRECYLASKRINEIRDEASFSIKTNEKKTKENGKKVDPCTVAYFGSEAACCIFANLI